jgi:hypothetical protein
VRDESFQQSSFRYALVEAHEQAPFVPTIDDLIE